MLTLISHHLCPYVQRAVIALEEKGVAYERIYVDLADKPQWFRDVSPLGKTPVLLVDGTPVFESAVILEYLEETQPSPLHPSDPLKRAEHRSWIEFGSAILNDIAKFYNAPDGASANGQGGVLADKFARLEARLVAEPWFDGAEFSNVDVVFGPVFRYFDSFDRIADFSILDGKPKVQRWRLTLARRNSIQGAVPEDYDQRLLQFLERRGSYLSSLLALSNFPMNWEAPTDA